MRKPASILPALSVAVALLAAAGTAYATTDYTLDFTFGGRGANPKDKTMTKYIKSCIPAGSYIVNGGHFVESTASYTVRFVPVNHAELTANAVYLLVFNCNTRPKKVIDLDVR